MKAGVTRVVIRAVKIGDGPYGDIALDDVEAISGTCDEQPPYVPPTTTTTTKTTVIIPTISAGKGEYYTYYICQAG